MKTYPARTKKASATSADAAKATASPQPTGDSSDEELTFPELLMDAIESETVAAGDDAIMASNGERVLEWLPDGESFVIRDKALLEKKVLPRQFAVRTKFMSFLRKLYRWGFRQVDKNQPGMQIFMHPNFIRGDKKRCLKLRSNVKKPAHAAPAAAAATAAASQQLQPQLAMSAMTAGVGSLFGNPQGFGGLTAANNQSIKTDFDLMRNMMTMQQASRNLSNLGGSSSLFPGQSPQGMMGVGGTATGAGGSANGMSSLLDRVEQNQQDLKRQIELMNMMFNKNNQGSSSAVPSSLLDRVEQNQQELKQQMQQLMIGMFNSNSSSFNSMNTGGMSNISIATEIMKMYPGMGPRRALELAREWKGGMM